MNLYIDTSRLDNNYQFRLENDNEAICESSVQRTKPLTKILYDFFAQNSIELENINNVYFKTSEKDTFTQTRNMVVISNALGFALAIPVNNKRFELPIYTREPNITCKK